MTKQPGAPLTGRFVERVTAPGRFGDGRGTHGLSLLVKVRTNGRTAKYWCQRIVVDGRPTSVGLGAYPVVTLAEAREAALETARQLRQGNDPRRQAATAAVTFAEAAKRTLDLHKGTWRNARSASIWWASMERHVFPRIGSTALDRLSPADVHDLVTSIHRRSHATARKVLQRIRAVTAWGVTQGLVSVDPSAAVKLPKNGTAPTKHHRALDHSEVAGALAIIRAASAWRSTRLLLEFTILTAVRSSEARLATWSEIDADAAVWEIPGSRMKTGTPHRVPLSARALEILHEARALSGSSGLVFETPRGGPLSDSAEARLLRREAIPGTVHGFRSAFRSWAAEQNVAREVAELCLAHAVAGVEGSYQRSDMLQQRRALMQAWSKYLSSVPGS